MASGEAAIGREAIRFALMLALSDTRFTEFMAAAPDRQFALARTFNISPEDLVTGLRQFGELTRHGIEYLRAQMPTPSGGKSN
jgi:hypothetical protein